MFKFVAVAAFIAAVNGYLNHDRAVISPVPAAYYDNVISSPGYSHRPNLLKFTPPALSPHVKTLPTPYETVEKPQVHVTRPVYTSYNPTVTNLPANHGAISVAAPVTTSYAHSAYPVAHPAPISSPTGLSGHKYVPFLYGHPTGLSAMSIAHANYGW